MYIEINFQNHLILIYCAVIAKNAAPAASQYVLPA